MEGDEVELRAFLISMLNKTKQPASRVCHLTFHEQPCVATLDTGLMAQEMLRFCGSDVQTKILSLHSRILLSRPLYSNKNRPKLNAPLRTHWRLAISVRYRPTWTMASRFPSAYEACPESIQPFWISREPVAWPWRNLAASQRKPYCASVNSHSPVGLVSW